MVSLDLWSFILPWPSSQSRPYSPLLALIDLIRPYFYNSVYYTFLYQKYSTRTFSPPTTRYPSTLPPTTLRLYYRLPLSTSNLRISNLLVLVSTPLSFSPHHHHPPNYLPSYQYQLPATTTTHLPPPPPNQKITNNHQPPKTEQYKQPSPHRHHHRFNFPSSTPYIIPDTSLLLFLSFTPGFLDSIASPLRNCSSRVPPVSVLYR